MRTLLATLLVTTLASQTAAEITIVVPNGLENVEGDGSYNDPADYSNGLRLQAMYLASDFLSLPDTPVLMAGFSFRPDGNNVSQFSNSWGNLILRLSTTNIEPTNLSQVFSENIGSQETIVFNGPITWATDNTGSPGGPKDFDVALNFETTFAYDPNDGNLLIDWLVQAPASGITGGKGTLDGQSLNRLNRSISPLNQML